MSAWNHFFFSSKSRVKFIILSLFIITAFAQSAWAKGQEISVLSDPTGFSILDVEEKGAFNMGPALGDVVREFEKTANKDVFKFDYTIFNGSLIGLWTKTFPEHVGPDRFDAVKVGVNVPTTEQLAQISVKLEIKGEKSMQTVPLKVKQGWIHTKEAVDWSKIGKLKEVVFVISPLDISKRLDGILYFDLDFYKMSFIDRYSVIIKCGMVFLLSILFAFLAFLIPSFKGSGVSGFKRDLLYGIAIVLISITAISIYYVGTVSPLDLGFSLIFAAAGLAGAVIAQILKYCVTGKGLSPFEVFRNILIAGVLAVSSSRQELLQAPSGWMQLLMVNYLAVTITFIAYQLLNFRSMILHGKHLRAVTGIMVALVPYLFNWLLLLENSNLVRILGNAITLNLISAWPAVSEALGRILVVFIFNEIFANGIGLLVKERLLKTLKAHLFMLFVSVGVIIAPLIADLGSVAWVGTLPVGLRGIISIITTALSFAGLWGEVYLITGIALDGGHRVTPTWEAISKSVNIGMKKGMAYSAILIGLLYSLKMLLDAEISVKIMSGLPMVIGILAGTLVFPLLKTIIETFDGSQPFFLRTRYSYRDPSLYARGAVAGFGFTYMITHKLFLQKMPDRILFGLIVGFLASGGVSILRDAVYGLRHEGRIQSWRLYLVDSILGAFIGSAAAFYLDALQIPVVIEKFKVYTSAGFSAVSYITYPLVNKWGRIDLGTYTGGPKLLFTESLAGVINWSIAAWLFAINKVFMQAFFEKDKAPIKFFFSKAGFAQLIEHMLYVLRWGLWMSPIIFTFLRMMPDPTWYNQDGAIHTLVAIYNNVAMSPDGFRQWSLDLFVWVLAFDFFRVLIWMDHMGLRVATLVNLSFLGLDRLDERIARFIGPVAAQRYIPEAVKRFATWAPLLIPFYLPRGKEWDYAWSKSEAIQNAARAREGIVDTLVLMPIFEKILFILGAVILAAILSFAIRSLRLKSKPRRETAYELNNREYRVVLRENGDIYSEVVHKECDISRRSYDRLDPCGRILYIADTKEYWPVIGNFPQDRFEPSRITKDGDSLKIVNTANGVRTTIYISLPDKDATSELWDITVENMTDKRRDLKVVPYLEWVLNGGLHDRFHTQYARLYPEMEYISAANAIVSWQKSSKCAGVLASDVAPRGFLTSRVDFMGRARSIWSARIFKKLDFHPAKDCAPYPTFDPIGSFMIDAPVAPMGSFKMRLMMGYGKNKTEALASVKRYLKPDLPEPRELLGKAKEALPIGHGKVPEGTPSPYFEYLDNGEKLRVLTPYTPRPFDHTMSNPIHSMMVTNRGLHTSSNGNSQQNRLTPDWPDTVTKEVPTEAFYLYDPDSREWYSPTYNPLNDERAENVCEFGVDGTALFRMKRGVISTELTVFVPPEDPLGVYLLTVRNSSDRARRIRIAPYFQMVLGFHPEKAGPLQKRYDKALNALFFHNPRNIFRSGWGFFSMSLASERLETNRGRFFGKGRWVDRPFMVENARPDSSAFTDDGQIAGFLSTVEIPANGEITAAFVLGQTDDMKEAKRLTRKYKDVSVARKSLEETRLWWLNLMGTLEVKTNQPEFDRFQNWLKYQALAERIWARRGFYQTSGAYGFRDQLQDSINMIWVDPAIARNQIILHASQQFIEGDVFHWFFTLTDGRTAFSCRSHASDNPVWLAWAVVEYIKATDDYSILDEMTSYVFSEFPFAPLPKNKQGWGHLYHRQTRSDSVYRHCMRSINLLLEKRMGRNGLPLIQTGDWNDGLDEIGSEGRGESVWLGFFLYYIMKEMVNIIEMKEGSGRKGYYVKRMEELKEALERTWRNDRYLRAIHDDGTEIGLKGSGIWEIDALTAAWAVTSGINFERGVKIFHTALEILEKDNVILLGWPALREDTKPYLGRSSKYPEGVRENGMYCHGVQWLIKASRILAERFERQRDNKKAEEYRKIAYRLWLKISPLSHVAPGKIETYGGQPNKQAADLLTTFDRGRMIWHGYTGAAGWMLRQAFEGVVGASLFKNRVILPEDLDKPRGELKVEKVTRDITKSPLKL